MIFGKAHQRLGRAVAIVIRDLFAVLEHPEIHCAPSPQGYDETAKIGQDWSKSLDGWETPNVLAAGKVTYGHIAWGVKTNCREEPCKDRRSREPGSSFDRCTQSDLRQEQALRTCAS